LNARVDQAGAELREVENADDERDQACNVERNDAPGETGETLSDEELPGAAQRKIDEAPRAAQPSSPGPAFLTWRRFFCALRLVLRRVGLVVSF